MKYFTAQLWAEANSRNRSVRKKADQQWNRNLKSYGKQFDKIMPKLTRNAQRFFSKGMHDSELFSLTMGDHLSFLKDWIKVRTNFIEMKLLHPKFPRKLFTLQYSDILNYKIEYSSDSPIYDERDKQILGDWGYDELSLTKDKWLKHEILFDTGATITIEFKKFSYKVKRFKSKKDELKILRHLTKEQNA